MTVPFAEWGRKPATPRPRIRCPGLQPPAVEHDGGLRPSPVGDAEPLLPEGGDVRITPGGPLAADAVGQPLQVSRADGQAGQVAQVGAGFLDGRGLAGLPDGLAEHGRREALGAQLQGVIQGGKRPGGRPGSGSGHGPG